MNYHLREKLQDLLELYHKTLLVNVIPWWLRYGIDESGAINTCIGDDGTVISRDRWSWSQWRAIWVFSKLFNCIEQKQQWLDVAKNIYLFVSQYGLLDSGHWATLLDENGKIKRGFDSIYVDGFAIYAMAELYRATGEEAIQSLALRTFESVESALNRTVPPPAWPYPIPKGRISHGISMLFSIAYHELAKFTGSAEVQQASLTHHYRVMENFFRPHRQILLEWLDSDENEIASPEGTVCVPGHAIESMWFQIHIARAAGNVEIIKKAIEIIHIHLKRGWDEQFGGLFLAIDADGRSDVCWDHHDTKLWWPQTESLYATLLAYEHCQEKWCMDWHQRIKEWSFTHFPNRNYGEWHQKLTREGKEITDTLVLPVKDPFHLPRALIYCIEVLERMLDKEFSV
jgi:N-acylglucosamine 2-epimerase